MKGNKMALMATKSEKFSEELYFMLMSSPLSERIRRLAEKYDLNEKPLRKEMLEFGENLPERISEMQKAPLCR